jgi:CTP synthase
VKYVVVTGGVLSGIGKGIAAASIAKLLQKSYNLKIIPLKCEGYLNTDPGTMNPIEHGEVYVMDDGGEVDMDFGHYERFIGITTENDWNITMGKIYSTVIKKERKGEYLGKTVQLVPHVTDEIKKRLRDLPEKANADVCIIELGGTVGDIETKMHVEAVRQMKNEIGKENIIFIHLGLVPVLGVVGEQKSKPIQQSVNLMMQHGIAPDFILGRATDRLDKDVKEKIALFTNIAKENVISAPDVNNIYEIPINLKNEELDKKIGNMLNLGEHKQGMKKWSKLVGNMNFPEKTKKIAICGKYTKLKDSYASVIESITHASAHLKIKPEITWIETTNLSYQMAAKRLKGTDAIIVPGGFGSRGTEGKINAIRVAREKNIPFLGLCLGLQMAVIEYARDVCGLKDANSTEINKTTKCPIIDILPEQKAITWKGGTMRLGAYTAKLKDISIVCDLYKKKEVQERHRHRYEVNPEYHAILETNGLKLSGLCPNNTLVEFIELPKEKHKYFVATQAHPELKSRFEEPAPLFYGLMKATLE